MLLRKTLLIDDVPVWEKMTVEAHRVVKEVLLQVIEADTVRSIRRNVCDTVADLAIGTMMEDQPWPELFGRMDAWVKCTNYELRESSLYIFEMMAQFFVMVCAAAAVL